MSKKKKEAHWIIPDEDNYHEIWDVIKVCSHCKKGSIRATPHCPICGARMAEDIEIQNK